MSLHRLIGRSHPILAVCLLGALVSNATAAHIPGTSQLGGWVYIDRNNDGHLAFSNEPNPEYVIGDVPISLFSKVGNVETLLSTTQSDEFGRYLFENINPGTYVLRQSQPVEFVDGFDTVGALFSFIGQPIPGSDSAGVSQNNAFTNIVVSSDVGGEYYNFGERGLAAGYVSKRFLLASYPGGNTAVPEPTSLVFALLAACGGWYTRRAKRS